ncbi:MAG: shikimate kinase [Desulfovibrio sp.]|nr:shikimate kinase [Desulfovibrio sp.]
MKNSRETRASGPRKGPCVSVIGMAGAGKTTVGSLLAEKKGWAFLDTDNLLEALYACPLQRMADAMSKEEFVGIEAKMICDLSASFTVISTGGSAVYSDEAMAHLASLGPVVYLKVSLDTALQRIAANPQRGITLNPGETAADLFRQREPLYENAATLVCDADALRPEECVDFIRSRLKDLPDMRASE